MKEWDFALVETPINSGRVVLHHADCPVARAAADGGVPVMTMYGCQFMPDDIEKHSCLPNGNGEH